MAAEGAGLAKKGTTSSQSGSAQSGKQHAQTASTRELGLDLALIAAKYLFHTDHLHYGYWPSDLPVELANLRRAQENHSDLLMQHIPAGVRTILDVGTGTGSLAKRLIDAGYEVDCVSPSPNLTQRARVLLGNDQCIFECRYEDLNTPKRYDLILFSESFQYVKLVSALSVTQEHLHSGGHLLICDFFRKDTPEPGPFGGGHSLAAFRQAIADYPLRPVVDEDITAQTAPNLDLVADFVEKVVAPIKDRLLSFLSYRYPLPARFLRWAFRRHLKRADEKYFSGKRSGANFQIYKTYRLLLFQECSALPPHQDQDAPA